MGTSRSHTGSTVSPDGSPASNSEAVFPCPGKTKFGAISFSGCKTNFRKCARGCGRTKSFVSRLSSPNAIKSRSSARGSFKSFFGVLPNSFSSTFNFCIKDSGVSPVLGTKATAAFTNFGESGGQSTGDVCHNEDCKSGSSENFWSCAMASRTVFCEAPRFEPRATIARSVISSRAHPACHKCPVSVSRSKERRGARRSQTFHGSKPYA